MPINSTIRLRSVIIALLVALTPFSTARADTITVCAVGCDFATIQDAVDAASPGDVISVTDAVHTEAGIAVDQDVTIQGQGVEATVVQAHATAGAATDRVFFVLPGTTATIRDMTIRHGNPISEPESGGGIHNQGTLTVERCLVTQNSASAGGGLLNDGTLTVIDSTVSGNTARGGGIRYVECSTGGGVKAMSGTATFVGSTISGNVSEGKGGGVHISCPATLVLVNTTVSGNTTNNDGGGVYVNGQARFTHATLTGNSAVNGGGVYLEGSRERGVIRGRLSYTHTLIAGNVATRERYGTADCFVGDDATIAASTGNLVGDGNCNPAHTGDPLLAPLSADLPPVHALLSGSPAVDAIPADACIVEADQRGLPRPQGVGCDIGAFELEAALTPTSGPGSDGGSLCGGSAVPALLALAAPAIGTLLTLRRRRSLR